MSDRLYNSRAQGVLLSMWKWAKRRHNITWGSWWEPRTSCSPAQRVGVRDSSRASCGAAVAALGHPKGSCSTHTSPLSFLSECSEFLPPPPRGGERLVWLYREANGELRGDLRGSAQENPDGAVRGRWALWRLCTGLHRARRTAQEH